MDLTYSAVGATRVDCLSWPGPPAGFRAYEHTVVVGDGHAFWHAARASLMTWGIKTNSGFDVLARHGASIDVREGADYTLIARLGLLQIREPARVVTVVDQVDRVGFAYGTRVGHPVSGEEAFILTRDAAGTVRLTLRSLTRPAPGPWRLLFPIVLIAQRWYRRQYLQALRGL